MGYSMTIQDDFLFDLSMELDIKLDWTKRVKPNRFEIANISKSWNELKNKINTIDCDDSKMEKFNKMRSRNPGFILIAEAKNANINDSIVLYGIGKNIYVQYGRIGKKLL